MTEIWHNFGDRNRFAFEFIFIPDPDKLTGCVRYDSASWGAFRLWVHGQNLCEHKVGDVAEDKVCWYLFSLLEWLAEYWDPLLHEMQLPNAENKSSACSKYYASIRRLQNNEFSDEKERAWDNWWHRHALRAGRTGGLFPDVFIRRTLDFIEISWKHSPLPGMPRDFGFVSSGGDASLPVSDVAKPLEEALNAASVHLAKLWPSEETERFARRLETIRHGSESERQRWYLANTPQKCSTIENIIETLLRRASEISSAFVSISKWNCLVNFSPIVFMFGTASPNITSSDAEILIRTMISSYAKDSSENSELSDYTTNRHLSPIHDPHEEGYELALALLDKLDIYDNQDLQINISGLIARFDIRVVEKKLNDRVMRGVAIAGNGLHPTILINESHPANRFLSGKRFTLAHELCHILYDRGYGKSLALVSGPWAPHGVERRANAFAAMILMPEPILKKAFALSYKREGTFEWAQEVARSVGVGMKSTVDHLYNLGIIDESMRAEILEDINVWPEELPPPPAPPPCQPATEIGPPA